MRFKRKVFSEGGQKVPGYIVTFSDMVTLLLTFFVLLLSLAETQDPDLVDKGRDSFNQSMKTFGLGMLLGREQTLSFGQVQVRHAVTPPEDVDTGRIISADEVRTERIFEKIKQSMTAMPSQITGRRANFSVADIKFSASNTALDDNAKQYLRAFSRNLKQSSSNGKTLYVLGLAPDAKSTRLQYIFSAQRAQAVTDYLNALLPGYTIYCWGAGPGGEWLDSASGISKHTQIMLAILSDS